MGPFAETQALDVVLNFGWNICQVRIPFYGDYNETDPVRIAEEGQLFLSAVSRLNSATCAPGRQMPRSSCECSGRYNMDTT